MDFSILGGTKVRHDDGRAVKVGGPKLRRLLTYLIVAADRTVSLDQLAADLVPELPAGRGRAAVRTHLTELVEVIGPSRLIERGDGWRLSLGDDHLDAKEFAAEVAAAEAALAQGDLANASAQLARALVRWQEPVLADAAGAAWARSLTERLARQHQAAQEMWNDPRLASLRTGPMPKVVATSDPSTQDMDESGGSRASGSGDREPNGDPEGTGTPEPSRGGNGSGKKAGGRGIRSSGKLPRRGVMTFLMTDIVGSTHMWERAAVVMQTALARHDQLMVQAVEGHGGQLVRERGEGDSTFSVFRRATDGAAAALAAQAALAAEPWPDECRITVRMALLTGEAEMRDREYYGRSVNRVARIRAEAKGGQTLVSNTCAEIIIDHLPPESLEYLGPIQLRDLERPEILWSLHEPDAAAQPGETAQGETSNGEAANGEAAEPRPTDQPAEATARQHDAPEEPPASPDPVAPAATWAVVVGVDPAFFATNGGDPDLLPVVAERQILLTEPAVLIGRSRPSDDHTGFIDLSGPNGDLVASRRHALLERQADGRYTITDLDSSHGTFVNRLDQTIPPGLRTMLGAGDRVYVGEWTRLVLTRVEPATALSARVHP